MRVVFGFGYSRRSLVSVVCVQSESRCGVVSGLTHDLVVFGRTRSGGGGSGGRDLSIVVAVSQCAPERELTGLLGSSWTVYW